MLEWPFCDSALHLACRRVALFITQRKDNNRQGLCLKFTELFLQESALNNQQLLKRYSPFWRFWEPAVDLVLLADGAAVQYKTKRSIGNDNDLKSIQQISHISTRKADRLRKDIYCIISIYLNI